MEKFVADIVAKVNNVLWGDYMLLLFLLIGAGLFFSIRTRFIQVRKFGAAWKATFGRLTLHGEKAGADGMTSFQSLATAIAAQVGTGNLAGAATAIAAGGPGAIFWMWIAAFFGMATIYAEATLAQQYRVKDEHGEITGGPVYYIQAAFKGKLGKVLAALFAVSIILALGFMGNMVQSNSIGAAFKGAFGVNPIIPGIVVAVIAAFIFIGGVGSIASLTEKIVPIMACLYIVGALIVLVFNYQALPETIKSIFVTAFKPEALFGGVVGVTVKAAMTKGVARGLFSNEAGMGSTPHAHALAKVDHPTDQGLVAMMGVFIDTFVILNLTAFVIISSGLLYGDTYLEGIELTQTAFVNVFGQAGAIFIAITMFFFAFSTIIGWYFFGERNVRYLFGKKAVVPYAVLVVLMIVLGSTLHVQLVWDMSDMFNGLMVIPNLLGLLALSGVVVKLTKEKEESEK